ncbi:aminopeptidase N-like isoform X2 [Macrosteles quadrilineatus]|uniref:aminopeptidase N-like isoform X2 n=1 Tax=Macrosteles quadrilineatus TaxID=74068 RepID=UPI0023E1F576|nr:aminopeptidase N-like isoform X2 [Macrosteles quadrilineatus]
MRLRGHRMKQGTLLCSLVLLVTILCAVQAVAEYRLPDDVVPLEYKLDLLAPPGKISSNKDRMYNGKLWITVECKVDTNVIKLHSKELKISTKGKNQLTVTEKEKQEKLNVHRTEMQQENAHLIIELLKPLEKDKTYVVYLYFEGEWSHGLMEGFHRNNFKDEWGHIRTYAIKKNRFGAHGVFPCFDEPRFRAKFYISIGVRKPHIPITNMPQKQDEIKRKNVPILIKILQTLILWKSQILRGEFGINWYTFEGTPPISPHQVNFLISPLQMDQLMIPGTTTPLRVWAQGSSLINLKVAVEDSNKFVASVILPSVNFYKDYFGVNCPLPNLDLVSFPSSGHDSTFGMIIEEENTLVKHAELKESIRMAHNVATMWLDGMVTFSWWNDYWFSWSLSEHLATLAVNHLYPGWNIASRYFVHQTLNIYKEEPGNSFHTVLMPIKNPESVLENYLQGGIFFHKGPVLIRMVSMIIGEDTFKKGLQAFVAKYQFSSATAKDLWESLFNNVQDPKLIKEGISLENVMENWLTKTSYPLVIATRDYATNKITVAQQLYVIEENPSEHKDCWWIPLTYSTSQKPEFSNTKPENWLSCDERTMTFEIEATDKEWVILNNKMAGLYRIKYDTKNWDLIAAALKQPDFNKIDELNRVQLLTDSWDMFTHELNYKTAFGIINYLKQETDYLPWRVALDRIKIVGEKIARMADYDVFEKYMANLMTKVYEKANELSKSNDGKTDIVQINYIMIAACEYNIPECNKKAKELYLKWKETQIKYHKLPINTLQDLRPMVFCKGVQSGDLEFMLKYHRGTTNEDEEADQVLHALSCSENPEELKRYLDWSISDKSMIIPQFCIDAFNHVVKTRIGYSIAYEFFFRNFKEIYEHAGRGVGILNMYMASLIDQVTSEEELEKLKVDIKKVEAAVERLNDVDEDLEDSFSEARARFDWLKKHYPPLIEAIKEQSNL